MPELKFEQAQAVFHDEGNILVSASAGSGKTFVMIERLIRLITERKAKVGEILAVTFTELAAGEMKEKLKKALADKINQTGDRELVKELTEVPYSDISTIHSFCGRLIRTYFYKAGVQPDYKILDDGEASILRREAVDKTFKEFYDRGDSLFLTLADRHAKERGDKSFKEQIINLHAFCLINADTEKYLKALEEYYSPTGFYKLINQYKAKIDGKLSEYFESCRQAERFFLKDGKNKMVEFAKALAEIIERAKEAKDVYQLKEFSTFKLDLPRGMRLSGEPKTYAVELAQIRDKFKQIVSDVSNGFNEEKTDLLALDGLREHARGLFGLIRRFDEIYTLLKREENGLDFNDLEHLALKVLKDNDVAREVRGKYKYVFVDEYQDVNAVQEEIISLISNDNLFMVGDAKQSIYGFRGCRPEIFSDKLDRMQKGGEKTVLLNYNFRSAEAVLELVNKIFCYCMNENYYGSSYLKTSMLKGGGIYPEERRGRVKLHLVHPEKRAKKQTETPRVYDILQEIEKADKEEKNPVSALVANIISDELGKDFYDPKAKMMRPVKYSDITVLTRNRDNAYVKSLVKGLVGYGIPVVSAVKENVCDYPEIQMVLGALKLVDCFAQDIPLASTLKSVIGGFSDEELAEIVIRFNDDGEKGGFYNAYKHYIKISNTPLADRLREFDEYFKKIRMLADFVGAHGVLKRLVKDKNIEQSLFAECSGRLKVKRLRRLISASRAGDRPLTVKEFLTRTETFPQGFGLAESPEEESVNVMTIHASKGLEFPVVIVCGLELSANTREERQTVMLDLDMGFALKSYDDNSRRVRETPLRAIFRDRMGDNRLKEELRLFYVALTRASYSLHLTFKASKDERKTVFSGAKKFLDYLPKDIELTEYEAEELETERTKSTFKQVLLGKADEVVVERIKKDINYQYPHLADTVLPLKNSVTKACVSDQPDAPYSYVLYDENEGETSIERGNVAHKYMEKFDFSRVDEYLTQAEEMVQKGIISRSDFSKIDLEKIKRAISCPAFKGIEKMEKFPEQRFLVNIEANKIFQTNSVEQVVLQGIIDLLVIEGNNAYIIDYKYSRKDRESLKRTYEKQLELYAYAVEKSLGKKVQSKTIVNLYTGEYLQID